MKKILYVAISLLLVLTGCTKKAEVAKTQGEQTIVEIGDKFAYTLATCLRNDALVSYSKLVRGDEVLIVNEDEKFYFINIKDVVLAIEKKFVRLDTEDAFEEFTGYAVSGSNVYEDYDLTEILKANNLNDQIKVVDHFDHRYLVEIDGKLAYMADGHLSSTSIYVSNKKDNNSNNNNNNNPPKKDDTNENDGQDIDPNKSKDPTNGDGQDITLSANGKYNVVLLASSDVKKGVVLPLEADTYITIYDRGDKVYVLKIGEEISDVLVNGRKGTIESKYIRLCTDTYLSWTGYTYSYAGIYSDYDLTNQIKRYSVNTQVNVIDEVGDRYVIDLGDGQVGYMLKVHVSDSSYYVAPTPTPQPQPQQDEVQEWTDFY